MMSIYRGDKAKYLIEALDSLTSQILPARQVRIYLHVDGPIGLELTEVMQRYASQVYKVLWSETNIGLGPGLNRIIDALEDEEYVFRMDADDISLDRRFASQIAYMEENPDIELVGCQAQDIDEEGAVIGQRDYPVSHEECLRLLEKMIPILHPTFCFRSTLFARGVRYSGSFLTEDLSLVINLAKMGVQFSNIEGCYFQWRVDKNFFRRRRMLKRGVAEFLLYSDFVRFRHGIATLSWVYPWLRLLLFLLPGPLSNVVRKSGLRNAVAKSR